jgi:hypothetical protein
MQTVSAAWYLCVRVIAYGGISSSAAWQCWRPVRVVEITTLWPMQAACSTAELQALSLVSAFLQCLLGY